MATKVLDIVKQVNSDLQITKLEVQMKSILIESQDIRNRTMRDNLIFKSIDESAIEKWEHTTQVLANFIDGNLNSYNEIDSQISRGHRVIIMGKKYLERYKTNHSKI